jgi:DNA-directed RNA polymerase subunit RPC12/RpoP
MPGKIGGRIMYEDTYPWPIKCGVCLNEFTKEIRSMKAGKEVRCPECGLRLVYTMEQFERDLAEHRRLGLDSYRNMMRVNKPL